ncbi:hypothetical protein [Actinoplanes sp. NPDC026619]|uniref:hypothetical protein n=1 Tax=Actinoplanes sp. NPDC026619 TaxID=3155798 RepID=UPI0033C35399
MRRRHRLTPEAAAVLAAVASESLPYTDPRAGYPAAATYRSTRTPNPSPAPSTGQRRADGDEI